MAPLFHHKNCTLISAASIAAAFGRRAISKWLDTLFDVYINYLFN